MSRSLVVLAVVEGATGERVARRPLALASEGGMGQVPSTFRARVEKGATPVLGRRRLLRRRVLRLPLARQLLEPIVLGIGLSILQPRRLYEKGKLAHTLRHSVATELLASGVDLETVRDVLGHSNVTTTALYLHTIDERKRRAARQLKLV